jgi:hypothetical protein
MKTKGVKIFASMLLVGALVYAVALQPTETKIVPGDGARQDYFVTAGP